MRAIARIGILALVLGANTFAPSAMADTFGSGANSFQIDFVTIGNPGNPPDTTGRPNPAGSVPYEYHMGKYEVSEHMIDKANAVGALEITKTLRGPNKPATEISWFEAARFVNWLNTSTGNHPAYKFGSGGNFQLWQPSDPGYVSGIQFRNSLAKYFLPSVNEWYKAAYYDPASGTYYDFPTGSNAIPDGIDFVGDPNFQAIFHDGASNLGPNDITNVGLASPYGTVAQGGNVSEWNETTFQPSGHIPELSARAIRGSDWGQFSNELSSTHGNEFIPTIAFAHTGFRVASIVPEPNSFSLLLFGLVSVLAMRGAHCDFNHTNVADGGDFTMWRKYRGTLSGAPHWKGDANGDGAVNQSDYDIWRAQFGFDFRFWPA
jgi:formylglycine-generating enzyme